MSDSSEKYYCRICGESQKVDGEFMCGHTRPIARELEPQSVSGDPPIPEEQLTLESLRKYWLGIESVAIRRYNDTNDSKYLYEALDVRIHLKGLGLDTARIHELERERDALIERLGAAKRELADTKKASDTFYRAWQENEDRKVELESKLADAQRERDGALE